MEKATATKKMCISGLHVNAHTFACLFIPFPECINITLMGNYRSFTQNVTRDTAAKAGFDKGDGGG